MSSIREVTQRQQEYEAAQRRLKQAVLNAAAAGIPQAQIARVGHISRTTVRAWIKENEKHG